MCIHNLGGSLCFLPKFGSRTWFDLFLFDQRVLFSFVSSLNFHLFLLQQAHKRGNGRLPPPWAMVAIAVLGFNEIMTLLRYLLVLYISILYPLTKQYNIISSFLLVLHRNPIYLFLLFVGYLLVKALAVQLDINREFQNGVVRF